MSGLSRRRRLPLTMAPFPAGKDFAFTFIDDTDLSTRANTEPVYDFLWEHGIRGTKTVWVHRQKRTSAYRRDLECPVSAETDSGATLEDPDYLAFVRKLVDLGYEIALHGVAAGNSLRPEIESGLERFRALFGHYPRINIFHERNIDNLYAGYHKLDLWPLKWLERLTHRSDYLGHVEGSPYFWGDLAQRRITYMRVPFHTVRAVNTLRWNPSMPFHDARRPYVNYWFANSDGSDCERFKSLLKAEKVARLENERGACLVYTHFAKGFAKKRGDRYALEAGFVATIKGLSAYQNAWFPTASELLDRLRAVRDIIVEQDGWDVTIENPSGQAVGEAALHVSPGTVLADTDGKPCMAVGATTVALGTIEGNGTRRLRSNRWISRYRIQRPNRGIGRWERARLEMLNYIGMLEG